MIKNVGMDAAYNTTLLNGIRRDLPKSRILLEILRKVPRKKLFSYLARLNREGWLGELIPAWSKIKGVKAQASHQYTVDVHSLRVVKNIAENHDLKQAEKPELVLLAGLLHDIGKGIDQEKHEEAGAAAIPDILKDMGLPGEDVRRVEWLVREHSYMGGVYLVNSRDANPLIRLYELARLAQTPSRLTDLYLLSWADTFAAFRSERAATAVKNYYRDTYAVLNYAPSTEDMDLKSRLGQGQFIWTTASTELPNRDGTQTLKVAVKEDPGALWKAALALSQKGINIIRANIFYFEDGSRVMKFYVERPAEPPTAFAQVRQVFETFLADGSPPEKVIPPSAGKKTFSKKVDYDHTIAPGRTVIMVTTSDRLFLFYQISRALARFGQIHQVLATTVDEQVTDIFYITDHKGNPITETALLEQIRRELLAVI
jgi:[protein-PII] uridylyltransferase